jgi:hypothetical protein
MLVIERLDCEKSKQSLVNGTLRGASEFKGALFQLLGAQGAHFMN